jgi:hypothetical protein
MMTMETGTGGPTAEPAEPEKPKRKRRPPDATTGLTPNEFARMLRVKADRVRTWIKSGKLLAVNVAEAECSKPRFIILPDHLAEWIRSRQTIPPQKPRGKRRLATKDYFKDK